MNTKLTSTRLSWQNLAAFIAAVVIVTLIHEGGHFLAAIYYGEFECIGLLIPGLEVRFITPVGLRVGSHWAVISGAGALIGLVLGYTLLCLRVRINRSIQSTWTKSLLYWCSIIFLLFDPLNLSILPLLFNGDIHGIALGLNIHHHILQVLFLILLLINRELIIAFIMPAYKVSNKHPLFRPIPILQRMLKPSDPDQINMINKRENRHI